jgi:5-methylcytosine-specific restriction endonuclease McrA
VTVGCLALNASFEPLTMVPLKRALRLVIDGKAEIVEADRGRAVRSERMSVPRPAVIRLRKFVHVPRRFRRQVTNTFLFARDGYRCQYCGVRCGISDLTYDHVIPRAKGGKTTWDNIVSCCYPCNGKKGNRTPAEAKMALRTQPMRPQWVPAVTIRVSTRSVPDAWRDYLYWTGEIESDEVCEAS